MGRKGDKSPERLLTGGGSRKGHVLEGMGEDVLSCPYSDTAPANINGRVQGNHQALPSERYLCVDLHTYCVCSRVMAKTPFQLIQLWSQLQGCLLHPHNADMATLQNDREIPQNTNYLHPHSGNHHQKATASIRVCQQMLLCFLGWLTDSNTLVIYKHFRLLIVALRKNFHNSACELPVLSHPVLLPS